MVLSIQIRQVRVLIFVKSLCSIGELHHSYKKHEANSSEDLVMRPLWKVAICCFSLKSQPLPSVISDLNCWHYTKMSSKTHNFIPSKNLTQFKFPSEKMSKKKNMPPFSHQLRIGLNLLRSGLGTSVPNKPRLHQTDPATDGDLKGTMMSNDLQKMIHTNLFRFNLFHTCFFEMFG